MRSWRRSARRARSRRCSPTRRWSATATRRAFSRATSRSSAIGSALGSAPPSSRSSSSRVTSASSTASRTSVLSTAKRCRHERLVRARGRPCRDALRLRRRREPLHVRQQQRLLQGHRKDAGHGNRHERGAHQRRRRQDLRRSLPAERLGSEELRQAARRQDGSSADERKRDRLRPPDGQGVRGFRGRGRRGREVPGVAEILDKALEGERISDDEALKLLESKDLVPIGKAADELRARRTDAGRITFIIDRNVNYTNVCVTDCDFCAFYRRPGDRAEGYLLPKAVISKKVEETLAIGGTGVLMQGGHHPDLGIDYYEDLFRSLKERYPIHLHALSPPEIQHIARRSKLSVPATLTRLRDSGLDSIPGGGAEILVDRVRDIIAPKKTKSADWLGVMRHAHRLGMSTTATMMYGHVETLAERIEHMRRVRELQDETRGFRAFISWTFQPAGTRLAPPVTHHPSSFEYLLTQAVSRIYLDKVDHIQSSWVTQGMKVGQVALEFGADDLGSVMIEENVVSAAGTTHRASTDDFIRAIKALGKTPVQRDTLYRDVRVWK